MYDFWLDQQIDWRRAFRTQSSRQRVDLLERVESLRCPTPFVDQVETTNYCTFGCVMCPRGLGHMTRPVQHMSSELFQRIASQCEDDWRHRFGTERDPQYVSDIHGESDRIEILGLRLHHFGSPLQDPEFTSRVEWLKSNCTFPVHASVRGEHLVGAMARRLIESGIDRVAIPIDGYDRASYSSVWGRSASYDRACRGVKELLRAKADLNAPTIIDIQMINFGFDGATIERFCNRWRRAGATNVFIKRVFHYPDVDLEWDLDLAYRGPCALPLLAMVITADGRVVPCCADYDAEVVLGDARMQSLREIWDGECFRRFRRQFVLEAPSRPRLCARCGFYDRPVSVESLASR